MLLRGRIAYADAEFFDLEELPLLHLEELPHISNSFRQGFKCQVSGLQFVGGGFSPPILV